MDNNILISSVIVTLAGIVALNIQHIFRFFTEHVINTLFCSIKIEDSSSFYYAMQKYVFNEKINKVNNFYYKNFWDNWVSKSDGKYEGKKSDNLFFDYGYFLIRFKGRTIFLRKVNKVLDGSRDPWKNVKQSIVLYSFTKKGIFDLLHHIEEVYHYDTINYYFNSDGETKMLGPVGKKEFSHIFLNNNLVDYIKNDVDNFQKSEDKYHRLGIKYKRTYLFYGPAGTGKSSLVTAMSNHTRRNILNINISKDMTDATLIKIIAGRPDNCIILFEDIDCLFSDLKRNDKPTKDVKTNEKPNENRVTLSCILNILDGAYTPDNVIFILTTNHIDKLDAAIKRDGRTDVCLEITKPNKDTVLKYLEYVKQQTGKTVDIKITDKISMPTLEKLLM